MFNKHNLHYITSSRPRIYKTDIIDAFNTTSRYFDDILNINYVYFDNIVSQIYPSDLQLNVTEVNLMNILLYA